MKIKGRDVISQFVQGDSKAESPANHWLRITGEARWANLVDVRKVFPSCDKVGSCYVFNLGGNKYRLITKIHFPLEIVSVREMLSHKEYDKDSWKNGCW